MRGHQMTDAKGLYRLETVVPGEYPGRTPHIHVKVGIPGGEVITSQLYFPGVSGNERDLIYNPALLVNLTQEPGAKLATFNFRLPG
jgi:protocatechuate 3,4-dioxygenase beta subunit